jgi:predicted ATP-grasp superfamily ATP-dependent carboligase
MAQRANFVEEGIDRVQSYFRNVEEELQKLQSDLQERRERFQKKAEKRVKRFQKELSKNKVLKRAETFREDVGKQIEKQMEQSLETLLSSLQIASRSEVKKLDQKLNRINRKLKALDKVVEDSEAVAE